MKNTAKDNIRNTYLYPPLTKGLRTDAHAAVLGLFFCFCTKKEMPFLKYMDGTVFSCDVKQLKPEADIYQTLLDKFGLKAEECVFIDDRPVNCEGAQKAGIHTICFKSFKQAAAELEALGVK